MSWGEIIPNLQGEYTQYHLIMSFTDELLNYLQSTCDNTMQAIRSVMGAFTLECGTLLPPNTSTIYCECCTKVSGYYMTSKGMMPVCCQYSASPSVPTKVIWFPENLCITLIIDGHWCWVAVVGQCWERELHTTVAACLWRRGLKGKSVVSTGYVEFCTEPTVGITSSCNFRIILIN